MDGIRAFFRLIYDRAAGKQFEREMQASLDKGSDPKKAQANVNRLDRAFKGLGATIAATFTINALRNWFAASFKAVDQMEAAERKLAGTSRILGVELSFLEETSGKLQANLGLATPVANDLTAAMAKLTQRAGDVTKTGVALTRFLDLAAVNGLGADEALVALNQALAGSDEGLNRLNLANPSAIYKKWGAGADEASQAQAILNEYFEAGEKALGSYAARSETAAGKQDELNKKLVEAQTAFGEAFGPARVLGLEVAAEALNNFQSGVERTAGAAQAAIPIWQAYWNAAMGMLGMREFGSEGNPFRLPTTVVTPPAGGRPRGPSAAPFDPAAAARAGSAAATAAAAAERAQREMERRVEAMNEEAERWALTRGWNSRFARPDGGAPDVSPIDIDYARDRGLFGARGEEFPIDEVSRFETAYISMLDNIEGVSSDAAYQISSAFQDAFDLMREDGANLGNFFEGIGRGLAGAMLAGLAQFAQGKVKENVASAIEMGAKALGFTALGNIASTGAAAASAGQHLAAAAAWGLLAGGAGSARGAVTGGRGAIPASTRDVGIGAAQGANPSGPEVHIYIDPLDPSRPAYQRNVYTAQQMATERYGDNARVTVHPGNGAR